MKFSFGTYYGKLPKQAEVAGSGLTETVSPAHVRLPVHTMNIRIPVWFCRAITPNSKGGESTEHTE